MHGIKLGKEIIAVVQVEVTVARVNGRAKRAERREWSSKQ